MKMMYSPYPKTMAKACNEKCTEKIQAACRQGASVEWVGRTMGSE